MMILLALTAWDDETNPLYSLIITESLSVSYSVPGNNIFVFFHIKSYPND